MASTQLIDAYLTAAIRGSTALWPQPWSEPQITERVRSRVLFHGVAAVLADRCEALSWPVDLADSLRAEALAQVMWELRHRSVLSGLIEDLAEQGISSVLMKGTALAYSLYSDPALRRRGDTDLLVLKPFLERARKILAKRGFRRGDDLRSTFGDMYYQESWLFYADDASCHEIDLHWEVTNSRVLSVVLEAESVAKCSVSLPALCGSARGTDPVTQLVQASLNRALHGTTGYYSEGSNLFDKNRLAWAIDIDLIARSYSAREWSHLANLCCASGAAPICLDALGFARECFGTAIPPEIEERLGTAPQNTVVTRYISNLGSVSATLADLRATPNARAMLMTILARTFPSEAFLRNLYPDLPKWPVWALQLRRMLLTTSKLFRAKSARWS